MCRFYILMAACVGLLVVSGSGRAQSTERFKVRLSTVPMDGGMRNTVAGFGAASATLAGAKLSVTGTFDGLKSPATSAQVHSGVARGVRGNSIGSLDVTKSTKGQISGSVDLTPEQVKGLRDGHLYIEVASEKAPEGNLWGWLLK
jgi:ABC-type sugar transport system substrate-binding protein